MADAEHQAPGHDLGKGKANLASLAAEVERYKAEASRLAAELARAQQDVASKEQALAQVHKERLAADQDYLATIQKLRTSATQLRQSFEKTKEELAEQRRQVTALSVQLAERSTASEGIDKARAAITEAIANISAQAGAAGGAKGEDAQQLQANVTTALQRLEALTSTTERIGQVEEMTRDILWQLESAATKKPAAGVDHGGVVEFAGAHPIATGALAGLSVMVVVLFILVAAGGPDAADIAAAANVAVATRGYGLANMDGEFADASAAEVEIESPAAAQDQQKAPPDDGPPAAPDDVDNQAEEPSDASAKRAVAAAAVAKKVVPAAGSRGAAETQKAAAAEKPRRRAGTEKDRKELRRKLFKASAKQRWADVIIHGTTLRDFYRLDWEAELRLADAFRNSKRFDEAIEAYEHFVNSHPTSPIVDDVAFQIATLYSKQGKKKKARVYFKRVAEGIKSKLAAKARKALKKLR